MQKESPPPIEIMIDADACPVRDEVFKIAKRHQKRVLVVSNSYLRIPIHSLIKQIVVSDKFDAADDYIAEQSSNKTIVITADILLAERCIKTGSVVISPNGSFFTADNIGSIVATRAIMNDIRSSVGGENIGGPAAFTPADRSRFLQSLHDAVVRL
ncbi:MAG: YaiI/YqxD family protein [Robiginitomaculum sp.]|nr:YaiI/YqxD family protein [Robiginitomaculum sp.]